MKYHTAIIPRSKDKIADKLADFVKHKFFQPQEISRLIANHDPAAQVASWLGRPETTQFLGTQASKVVVGAFKMVGEEPIKDFLRDAAHTAVDKVNVAPALGAVLQTLTRDGRHQALLDATLDKLQHELSEPALRDGIAARVVSWLRTEHPIKEKLLPTDTISSAVAEAIVHNVQAYLQDIANKPAHDLRVGFDGKLNELIDKLQHDPSFLQKGEDLKAYIKHNEDFNAYVQGLWVSLRDWMTSDLKAEHSRLQQQVSHMGRWLANSLLESHELRDALNRNIQTFVNSVGADAADHLTAHISSTIKKWDAAEMSAEIERNIGADLQYIRISGTVVDGLIGLLLFGVFELVTWLKAA